MKPRPWQAQLGALTVALALATITSLAYAGDPSQPITGTVSANVPEYLASNADVDCFAIPVTLYLSGLPASGAVGLSVTPVLDGVSGESRDQTVAGDSDGKTSMGFPESMCGQVGVPVTHEASFVVMTPDYTFETPTATITVNSHKGFYPEETPTNSVSAPPTQTAFPVPLPAQVGPRPQARCATRSEMDSLGHRWSRRLVEAVLGAGHGTVVVRGRKQFRVAYATCDGSHVVAVWYAKKRPNRLISKAWLGPRG